MFFKKDKGLSKAKDVGRIYVFRLTLKNNKIIWKVGMTHSDRAIDRMFEVLQSFFQVFRYSPKCELRRDKKVLIPRLVEKHLHELLAELSYKPEKQFDGSTEFFHNLDEDSLLDYLDSFDYTELLKNKTTIKKQDLIAITEAIDKTTPTPLPDNTIPF